MVFKGQEFAPLIEYLHNYEGSDDLEYSIKFLLDLGVPVNYKHKLFGTALFAAISKESEIASRLLLERGAIPDEYDLEWLSKQKSLHHLLYDYLNMMSREDF